MRYTPVLFASALVVMALGGCSADTTELTSMTTKAVQTINTADPIQQDVFMHTDDGKTKTDMCSVTVDRGQSVESTGWFDGIDSDKGCSGKTLSYDVTVMPGQVYSYNVPKDSAKVTTRSYDMATASTDLTDSLAKQVAEPVFDLSSLASIVKDGKDVTEEKQSNGVEYSMTLDFAQIKPLFGTLNDQGSSADFTGKMTLTFTADNLTHLKFTSDNSSDSQSFTISMHWFYGDDVPEVSKPDGQIGKPLELTSEDQLRSFTKLS